MTQARRVALITGGTRGIGLGIARCLAREGLDLMLCGQRAESEVVPVLEELRALGVAVAYCPADVAKVADRERLLARTREVYGRLQVLVNNAGVAPKVRADLLEATEESFERLIQINLQGPYFLTQAVARWMIAQRQADAAQQCSIITVSSISSIVASVNRGDYCISKAGLSMATMLWAVRLGEYGIPVYEVRPGVTRTDMTSGVKDKYDKLIGDGLCVQQRWGEPEDTGKVVAALARGDFGYSTGQVIDVDGGLMLRRL